MATTETHQATDETDAPGWTAEVELRRYYGQTSSSFDWPPNPNEAEDYDPHTARVPGGCKRTETQLRELADRVGFIVEDSRIVLPEDVDHARPTTLQVDIPRTHGSPARRDRLTSERGLAGHIIDLMQDNDPRPIYSRTPRDHDHNRLQRLYEQRRKDGRTLLVIIIARDAATGTGKTTLAVQLAKTWDRNGWTADRATLDPSEYARQYTDDDTPKQSCILLDEAEQAADNRRSMSNQNVKLSHLWATMRYREIYSIVTLPSASMLDKRLKELADVKIVVHSRGTAVAYKTKIDDHSGEYRARRLCRLRWDPLDNDPEYQRLTQKKADRMRNYADSFSYTDDDADDAPDPKTVRRDYRNAVLTDAYERTDLTQQQLADVFDLSRSAVSKIVTDD